jgi:hypothetical protein
VISNWASFFTGTMQYYSAGGAPVSPVGEGAFAISGNTLSWTPSVVPEPTGAVIGLLLGFGFLRRRRTAPAARPLAHSCRSESLQRSGAGGPHDSQTYRSHL